MSAEHVGQLLKSSHQSRFFMWYWAVCILALAALAFQVASLSAGEVQADVQILSNTTNTISLRYNTPPIYWSSTQTPERSYQTPVIARGNTSWQEGTPQLPVRIIWLVIPPGATPSLMSVSPHSVHFMPVIPAPVPSAVMQESGSETYVYNEDPSVYSSGSVFPDVWVEMQGPETFRDRRIIRLLIYPFRYQGGVQYFDSLDVQVQLQGGSTAGGFNRMLDDEFYEGLIANWQGAAKNWRLPPARTFDLEDPWPQGDFYKIQIENTGVYKLTYNDLVGAGINLNGLDPRTIRMFNNGGEILPQSVNASRAQAPTENAIKIIGEEDGSFDPGDEIGLYGRSVHDWN
ncbi:MAG: C25 family peptidase propeptide domain-containing protein, partial [bacterium]